MSNLSAPSGDIVDAHNVAISGKVIGGNIPVNGAKVYLFAAGTAGNAGPGLAAATTNKSVSLIKSTTGTSVDTNGNYYVTSGADGSFVLTGKWGPCTTGQQLYVYALGGNTMGGDPTKSGGVNGVNATAAVMAVLGECSTVTSATVVNVNEVSTVAAAYAVAGFATDSTHISDDEGVTGNTTQAQAVTGMANAFSNVFNLVSEGSGTALTKTPAGNGTVPTATINTIADIMADCIQTSGVTSTPCADLYAFTGTPTTADTVTAMMNLAHNPVGVSTSPVTLAKLYSDMPSQVPFQPTLATAPNDFTLAISLQLPVDDYGKAADPYVLATDWNGDVWVGQAGFYRFSNSYYTSAGRLAGSKAGYAGSLLAVADGYGGDYLLTVAVDSKHNVYMTDYDYTFGPYLHQLPVNGASAYNEDLCSNSYSLAIDQNDTTECALNSQAGAEVIAFGPTPLSSSVGFRILSGDYTDYQNGLPVDMVGPDAAVDSNNNVWIDLVNGGNPGGVAVFSQANPNTYARFHTNSIGTPSGLAIDHSNSVWVVDSANNALVKFTGSGTSYTMQPPYTGGGLKAPRTIAIDGSGNAWVPNTTGGSISKFSSAGVALTPTSGFTGTAGTTGGTAGPVSTSIGAPNSIAIDGSGNVWVAVMGASSGPIVMYVGLGTPVVAPLALASKMNKIGARP
ncbi:hypothetical protein ACFQBQ_06050 [Granulicella cerasi]|uniref:NHL repeat containing protein n=1 Tax=Granulicella cerasi TaxID=741063 RepID=A0ABW1Z7J1_9BACT|nr:hypothetical protein [Granulicella cerasi]